MAAFHTLTVTDIRKTIRDAVVLTLKPESGDFSFIQGQYLTFKRDFNGTEIRRSYSICAAPDEQILQVGIKRVEDGAFSSWANDDLKIGDTLEAMEPMGRFHTPLNARQPKHYLGFAGGSGITPVLSILKASLNAEPESRFTLVYANRGVNTIMFREELEDLKNTHMGRLNVIHIFESDAQDIDLFKGRVDENKCAALFKLWIDIEAIATAFICGPEPMMQAITSALKSHGLSDEQIKFELFASSQPGRLSIRKANKNNNKAPTTVNLSIDGQTRSFSMERGQSVLDAAIENSIDAPFACKAGVCSTCRCKLLHGEVEMIANHALEDYEVEAGFILSCQSYPLTEEIAVDYDAH